MAHSTSRLLLYAILSSMEQDLRDLLSRHLPSGIDAQAVFDRELFSRTLDRYIDEMGETFTEPSLSDLLPFTDFGDLCPTINANREQLPSELTAYIRSVTPRLNTLVQVRNRVSHSRPLLTNDVPGTMDAAEHLASTKIGPWSQLRTTLELIKEQPGFLLGIKIPTPTEESPAINHNLPIPEFDETGFIGREREKELIINACKGPFPVLSVLGEGGIGKTALALAAIYELIDQAEPIFDAVVWTTCKTSFLSISEIKRIEDAIADSLGMFRSLSRELVGADLEDPVEEILAYLKEFRILLVIDNLETVLDERVRHFLEELPQGSKVLITSRIGLGALDRPIKVPPMSEPEAVSLLRTLALVRQVDFLTHTSNKQLATYCKRLNMNPGFIKWLVAGVQAGRPPEDLLAHPDIFLDFCLSNVYGFLDGEARSILRALLCVPGKHSQAEVAYLSDLPEEQLRSGINQLLSTNMVSFTSFPLGNTYQSLYEINDLARAYLSKNHPLSAEESKRIGGRRTHLMAAKEEMSHAAKSRPYDLNSIALRSSRDVIVTKFLLNAMKMARRGHYADAETPLERAKSLAPDFYEVHRVAGVVNAFSGDVTGARQEYEVAIELEPSSAPLRYFFAGFLMRFVDDTAGAAEQLRQAMQIDGKSSEIRTELARALLYTLKYDEALTILEDTPTDESQPEKTRKILADLRLQCFTRKADLAHTQHEPIRALDCLERSIDEYKRIPTELLDRRMIDRLQRILNPALSISAALKHIGRTDLQKRAEQVGKWISDEIRRPIVGPTLPGPDQEVQGTISALPPKETFGFIKAKNTGPLFFHRSNLFQSSDWDRIAIGSSVSFRVSEPDETGRRQAVDIKIVEFADPDRAAPGTVLSGVVATIKRDRGYAFVRSVNGPQFFFHNSMVSQVSDWTELSEGDEVEFTVAVNPRDQRAVATDVKRVAP